MQDTSDFIRRKQFEIIYAKPLNERVLMALQLMENAIFMANNRIRRQNPDFSEIDVKIQRVKEFYSDSFTKEQFVQIEKGMRAFFEKNPPKIYEEI